MGCQALCSRLGLRDGWQEDLIYLLILPPMPGELSGVSAPCDMPRGGNGLLDSGVGCGKLDHTCSWMLGEAPAAYVTMRGSEGMNC